MLIANSVAMVASMQFQLAGACDCHVYAVQGPDGIVLIDSGSGTDNPALLANLADHFPDVAIRAVILTHCHADHAAGAAGLRKITGCAVIAPETSRRIIETADEVANGLRFARQAGLYPPGFRMRRCPVDDVLRDGVALQAAGLTFRPIHVRGHSPDAFCLLSGNRLFSGDVLFYGGVLGLINAEGSDLGGYRQDLHKLADLGVEMLFPGHGLFTLRAGQRHIDAAIALMKKGVVPRMIGQWDQIF